MATIEREIKYHCDNDCVISGCPSHLMKVIYQSASDSLSVDDGRGQSFHLDINGLKAFRELIKQLEYRTEIKSTE